jgi:hypothetical protein
MDTVNGPAARSSDAVDWAMPWVKPWMRLSATSVSMICTTGMADLSRTHGEAAGFWHAGKPMEIGLEKREREKERKETEERGSRNKLHSGGGGGAQHG